MIELSIIIPAYNAALALPSTLLSIDEYLTNRKIKAEIIVSDDGSTDQTKNIIRKLIKNRPRRQAPLLLVSCKINRGKGSAVKQGAKKALGKYILMMDADNSMPISEIELLWPYRKKFGIVIGSRFIHGGRYRVRRFNRIIISKLGNVLFRRFFGLDFHDTQCGFKLFSRQAVEEIFPKSKINRFGFDIECLVLASKENFKIKEVPIGWQESPMSSIHVIHSSWETFLEVKKIRRMYGKKKTR